MKKRRIQFFNLVEVALALGVIAIAISSIMGLLPVALRANTSAVAENSIASAFDLVKAYVDSEYRKAVKEGKTLSDFAALWQAGKPAALGEGAIGRAGKENVLARNLPAGIYKLGGGNYYLELRSGDLSQADDGTGNGLADNSSVIVDFGALVSIWSPDFSANEYLYLPPSRTSAIDKNTTLPGATNTGVGSILAGGSSITDNDLVNIRIEIRYPVAEADGNREFKAYSLCYAPGDI